MRLTADFLLCFFFLLSIPVYTHTHHTGLTHLITYTNMNTHIYRHKTQSSKYIPHEMGLYNVERYTRRLCMHVYSVFISFSLALAKCVRFNGVLNRKIEEKGRNIHLWQHKPQAKLLCSSRNSSNFPSVLNCSHILVCSYLCSHWYLYRLLRCLDFMRFCTWFLCSFFFFFNYTIQFFFLLLLLSRKKQQQLTHV